MRTIVKHKWFMPVLWIVLCFGLFAIAPDLNELVREKGQLSLPEGHSFTRAQHILQGAREREGRTDEMQIALVVHAASSLDSQAIDRVKTALEQLENDGEQIGILDVITPFSEPELEDQLWSKDRSTVLTMVSIERGDRPVEEIRQR